MSQVEMSLLEANVWQLTGKANSNGNGIWINKAGDFLKWQHQTL